MAKKKEMTKAKTARESAAADRSSAAGKRSGQGSKAARNAPSKAPAGKQNAPTKSATPAAKNGAGQKSKSTNGVAQRSQLAASTSSAKSAGQRSEPKTGASAPAELSPEITVKETKELVVVTIKYRGDANGGHNHIIVDDVDDNHVSVGLTTRKKKGKNNPNYSLEISPLGDGKQSYVRRQGTVAPKKEYVSPRNGEMTKTDYTRVKEYGDKAKKKYLDNKNAKKNSDVPNT